MLVLMDHYESNIEFYQAILILRLEILKMCSLFINLGRPLWPMQQEGLCDSQLEHYRIWHFSIPYHISS